MDNIYSLSQHGIDHDDETGKNDEREDKRQYGYLMYPRVYDYKVNDETTTTTTQCNANDELKHSFPGSLVTIDIRPRHAISKSQAESQRGPPICGRRARGER